MLPETHQGFLFPVAGRGALGLLGVLEVEMQVGDHQLHAGGGKDGEENDEPGELQLAEAVHQDGGHPQDEQVHRDDALVHPPQAKVPLRVELAAVMGDAQPENDKDAQGRGIFQEVVTGGRLLQPDGCREGKQQDQDVKRKKGCARSCFHGPFSSGSCQWSSNR